MERSEENSDALSVALTLERADELAPLLPVLLPPGMLLRQLDLRLTGVVAPTALDCAGLLTPLRSLRMWVAAGWLTMMRRWQRCCIRRPPSMI